LMAASLTKPVRRSQLLTVLASVSGQSFPATAPTAALPTPATAAHRRVLIVEDNMINQKVAARMLERLGLRADVAGNGREALRMFESLPYDLILMDCQMPEMDGYEATREIRVREGPAHHVPILAMTADPLVRETCLASGMDDFIVKPVRMTDLAAAIEKRFLAAGV